MDYRPLGRTGMMVSPLCLGAMMFGEWGEPDESACVRITHRALDAGINFVDTADLYSDGQSEEIVGKALRGGKRDDVVLATKFHFPHSGEANVPNRSGNSRRWIMKAVDASLRRLQTDWIDLYQVHRIDPNTDLEETLSALTDLRQAGKIRAFGTSIFPAHEIVRAHWIAERRNLAYPMTEQPPYSLLVRGIEADVLPVAHALGLGVLTWSPLASGWLSGRYRQGRPLPPNSRQGRTPWRFDMSRSENVAKLAAVERLHEIADSVGLTLVELAIGFVLAHPVVTSAIIGPRTMEHLESHLAAGEVTLSDETLERIDTIVPPGTVVARRDAGVSDLPLTARRVRRRLGVSSRA